MKGKKRALVLGRIESWGGGWWVVLWCVVHGERLGAEGMDLYSGERERHNEIRKAGFGADFSRKEKGRKGRN